MAIWTIRSARGGLKLTYRNGKGAVHECGEASTGPEALVNWIVRKGEPCPGDIIRLPDGCVLVCALQTAHA